MSSKKGKIGLLDDHKVDMEESYHQMIPSQRSINSAYDESQELQVKHVHTHAKPKPICKRSCSWKCLFLSCTLTECLVLLIVILAVVFKVAPQFAQNTLNHSTMEILNGTIYNPTNSSITLNTTIQISNAGFLSGELHSSTVNVSTNGVSFGQMTLPTLQTVANGNTIVQMSSVLQITNKTHFQTSCKALLHNTDQVWRITGHDVKLTVDTGVIGTVSFSVHINKDLVLKGAQLYNFIATNFNVDSATTNTISTFSTLNFISDSIFTFYLPDTLLSVYYEGTYIGYAPLPALGIKPGLNTIPTQDLIIESTSALQNRGILGEFFSHYIGGENQHVVMTGPVMSKSKGYPSTVLDGVLEETLVAMGYTQGNLAFGGVVTSATQTGWKVGGTTVRGAYSNMINPLNVPLRILNLTASTTLPKPVKYHVNIVPVVGEYDCTEHEFASLSIGHGIHKTNHNKTWFDVAANDAATYFVIAEPPKASKPAKCMDKYPFSCCFAALSTAYACLLNPEIQTHPSDGELDMDYMPLILDANITMLIDNKFAINTSVHQDFFPLYFGWQVYGGYASDLELSCKSFTYR
eukprot:673796_1